MAVFSKGCFMNKSRICKVPAADGVVCPEAKVTLPPLSPCEIADVQLRRQMITRVRRAMVIVFHTMNFTILMFLFIAVGMMILRQCRKPLILHRYQGFCAVPIDSKEAHVKGSDVPNYRVMQLQWSPEPQAQKLSAAEERRAEQLVKVLREELEIDGMVEKVSVLNNGHQVNFIHDFSNNVTNIVDVDRCFTMDLDPELVLMPEAFVLNIERGGDFDVSRVRSALRAMLPAVRDLTALPPACRTRPTYRLYYEDHLVLSHDVEKRSVEAPPHQYMHFSGKHVHEIEIGNFEDVRQYEKNTTG